MGVILNSSLNVPVPPDHCNELFSATDGITVDKARLRVLTIQISSSLPAFGTGAGVIVRVILETASAQDPGLLTVIVRVAEPLVLSLAPRVYTGLSMAGSEKVPSPLLDQKTVPFV